MHYFQLVVVKIFVQKKHNNNQLRTCNDGIGVTSHRTHSADGVEVRNLYVLQLQYK